MKIDTSCRRHELKYGLYVPEEDSGSERDNTNGNDKQTNSNITRKKRIDPSSPDTPKPKRCNKRSKESWDEGDSSEDDEDGASSSESDYFS